MDMNNDRNKGDYDMAVLMNEVTMISEITDLSNKIKSFKLSIVEELGKIKMKEMNMDMETDPNLIMESLMIEYYTSNIDKRIELAEESIALAFEAEEIHEKNIIE